MRMKSWARLVTGLTSLNISSINQVYHLTTFVVHPPGQFQGYKLPLSHSVTRKLFPSSDTLTLSVLSGQEGVCTPPAGNGRQLDGVHVQHDSPKCGRGGRSCGALGYTAPV